MAAPVDRVCDSECDYERDHGPKCEKRKPLVNETCTVDAWITYLQELQKENPNAVMACRDTVMHTNNACRQMWVRGKSGLYSDTRRYNVPDESYFNVLLIESHSMNEKRAIKCVLYTQDEEMGTNSETDFHKFINLIEELSVDDQLEAVRRNTRFREKLYFFRDTGCWYTLDDVTGMCGGKLLYNFDKLFTKDKKSDFIMISKIPFRVMSKSILKDPVADLLNQYNDKKKFEAPNVSLN